MTFDRAISFGSTVRELSAGGIDNPWEFFGQFLEEQRALAPSAWPDDSFEPGSTPRTLKLVMPEQSFGYDAVFERIDYVATSGRAAATSR
jgi:hypothetical protein